MTKRNLRRAIWGAISLSVVLIVTGATSDRLMAQDAAASAPPAPRIIVIDRNVVMRLSSAGKDMLGQTQALSKKADDEFKGQAEQLQKDAIALQQQMAILAPDVRAQKQKAFEARQEALKQKVEERQQEIQNGFNQAGRVLDQALGPILQTIMKERGANLLLDRSSVILATIDVDVTATAVQRLDKALPHLKVELQKAPVAPPKGPLAAQK